MSVPTGSLFSQGHFGNLGILALLLACFVGLHSLLPLATAIKIGADEDFELAKIPLALAKFRFYDEIWNDQPLLHTFLITQATDFSLF